MKLFIPTLQEGWSQNFFGSVLPKHLHWFLLKFHLFQTFRILCDVYLFGIWCVKVLINCSPGDRRQRQRFFKIHPFSLELVFLTLPTMNTSWKDSIVFMFLTNIITVTVVVFLSTRTPVKLNLLPPSGRDLHASPVPRKKQPSEVFALTCHHSSTSRAIPTHFSFLPGQNDPRLVFLR